MRNVPNSTLIVILLLTLSVAPMIAIAGEIPPPRAPPLKTGMITSDEVWGDHVFVRNATIGEGVKVKVEPGVIIYMDEMTNLLVAGSLIINGTADDPVQIMCPTESEWSFINVQPTGGCHIENATFMDTSDTTTPLQFYGKPSVLKNVDVEGGWQGIWFQNNGGHLLENVTVHDTYQYCFAVIHVDSTIEMRNISTRNSYSGSFVVESSYGLDIRGMDSYNHTLRLMNIYDSDNIRIKDVVFKNPTYQDSRTGMTIVEGSHLDMENVILENCDYGIWAGNGPGIVANFTNLRTLKTNNSIGFYPYSGGSLKFIDCDIASSGTTIEMDGSTYPQRVELINTTWTESSPINVENDAIVNISWHVDVRVTDGIGGPLDARLSYREAGKGSFTHLDSSDGRFDKLVFLDRTIEGGFPPDPTTWDFQVKPSGYSADMLNMDDRYVNAYTLWEFVFDLPPTNTLPDPISVMEDEWLEMDLYDHFIDPELQEMEIDIQSSPEINVVRTGGPTSGDIRIKNREPDWFGTGWMKVTATDTGGNSTTANVTVEVISVNDAPRFIDVPMRTIEEDSWTFFNLTGRIVDVEGDPVSMTLFESDLYTLEYDDTTMNLTVWPEENYYGMLHIEVNLSDGDAWTIADLLVNVTPVNDAPEAIVRYVDGSAAPLMEWETGDLIVYDVEVAEDTSVKFWIDATDVDSTDLTYEFMTEDLRSGSIEVETKDVEGMNGTQSVVIPTNFTYVPAPDDNTADDLVRFMVGDSEDQTIIWIWFNVTPVNDPIEFGPPAGWNISVDKGIAYTLDISQWITDIDGDIPVVTTDSDRITIEGTVLTLMYDQTFTSENDTVVINVSDGETQASAALSVMFEIPLGKPIIEDEGDDWVVTVEGAEGKDLWVVVEDDEGNRISYPMSYSNGKYTATIPKDDVDEDWDLWISGSDDGGPIDPMKAATIPEDEEDGKERSSALLCCGILFVSVVILLIVFLFVIVILSSKGKRPVDEE